MDNSLKVSINVLPEDFIELHAGRLLLLIYLVGEGSRKIKIDSRTKLAKLDFFLRYPSYLKKAIEISNKSLLAQIEETPLQSPVDPSMIRYFYGPWDERYYEVLTYLIARNLISIEKNSKDIDQFVITEDGIRLSEELKQDPSFSPIIKNASVVFKLFGNKTGNQIKEFIYENFPEIVSLSIGEEILETEDNVK